MQELKVNKARFVDIYEEDIIRGRIHFVIDNRTGEKRVNEEQPSQSLMSLSFMKGREGWGNLFSTRV